MFSPWFNKLNKWVLLLLTFVFFALGTLLIWLSVAVVTEDNTWLVILTVICFLIFTMMMNGFISKVIVFKPRPINYPEKNYLNKSADEISLKLKKEGFSETITKFGKGYIKIKDRVAYKVVLILDDSLYFNNQEEEKKEPTKGIDKCTKFVGFELFLTDNENIRKQVVNFSFSGDNVLYEGFYYNSETNMIVEANVIDPEIHKKEKAQMLSFLGLEEVMLENKETEESKEDIKEENQTL